MLLCHKNVQETCSASPAEIKHTSPEDKGKNLLEAQVEDYVDKLAKYPWRKQEMISTPEWYFRNFGEELRHLQGKLERFPDQAEFLTNRLDNMVHLRPFLLEQVIRQKLTLRHDARYAEFPLLVKIVEIREELDLPSELEVNTAGIQCGLYILTPEHQRILADAKKLFVTGIFQIGHAHQVELKFELNFLMSCEAYADACRVIFDRDIIQLNITESKKAFSKHYSELYRTCKDMLLDTSVSDTLSCLEQKKKSHV
jgi:hypothetical protein